VTLDEGLRQGTEQLNLDLDQATLDRLLVYLGLIGKWNRVFNLTAIKNPEEMLTHHLLDSLAVIPYLTAGTLLDIGSGAGLPGIPLALARPEISVVMLDSNSKKTRFIQQAIVELGLSNAEVVHSRVEDYKVDKGFDTVISRAFSSLSQFVEGAMPMLGENGRFLAMKGKYPDDELAAVQGLAEVIAVHRLDIPYLNSQRHLVEMVRK
jgi:16S rRNA (guanine527-N7)-methyltransferase